MSVRPGFELHLGLTTRPDPGTPECGKVASSNAEKCHSKMRESSILACGRVGFRVLTPWQTTERDYWTHETDLIAELGGDRIIGIEIKAIAAPTTQDAKHLSWLRDSIASKFVAGVILHTGPHTYELGDRVMALPISTLWA